MTKAPEVIVASVEFERLYGKKIKMSCVTVGTDGVPDPFEPTHYVMKDTHDALVKAADELAQEVNNIKRAIGTVWANEARDNAIAALAAYKQARGETQ